MSGGISVAKEWDEPDDGARGTGACGRTRFINAGRAFRGGGGAWAFRSLGFLPDEDLGVSCVAPASERFAGVCNRLSSSASVVV